MRCPYCGRLQSRVVDSRQSEDGSSIRRRRECEGCGRRFTTYERIDMVPLIVVKKDQTRETFDVNKLRAGMVKACEKRPVSLSRIDELARDIERRLTNLPEAEVTSQKIGEMVMDGLKELDEVAYVRFASVYRQFRDIQTFRDELNKLLTDFEPGKTDGNASGGVELVVQRRFRVAAVTTWIIWELWDGTGLEGKRWEKADRRRGFGGFEVV